MVLYLEPTMFFLLLNYCSAQDAFSILVRPEQFGTYGIS